VGTREGGIVEFELGTVLKILNLGTIGVAGIGLLLWQRSFHAVTTTPSVLESPTGSALVGSLKSYLWVFVAALAASMVVQLAVLVISKYWPEAPYKVLLNIGPEDVGKEYWPTVFMNGTEQRPTRPQNGMRYSFDVNHDGNFSVDVQAMRDKLRDVTTQYHGALRNTGNAVRTDDATPQGLEPLQ
jgi:hypothetical protein